MIGSGRSRLADSKQTQPGNKFNMPCAPSPYPTPGSEPKKPVDLRDVLDAMSLVLNAVQSVDSFSSSYFKSGDKIQAAWDKIHQLRSRL
jgi:hypothetical protein